MTPLLLAAKNGHTNVVKILLEQDNLDLEINLKNCYGHNFLCEAIFSGHQYVALVHSQLTICTFVLQSYSYSHSQQ